MTNNEIKTKLNEMQEYINNCLLDLNNYPFPAINGNLIKNIDKVVEISHSIEEDIADDKELRDRLRGICTWLFRETGWACGGFSGEHFDIFKEKALEEVCDLFKEFTNEFREYKKKEKEERDKAVAEFNARFGIEEENKKNEEDTVFIDNDFKIQEYDRLQRMLDKIMEDKSLSEFIEHTERSITTFTSLPFDKCLLSHKINHLMGLFIDCLKGNIRYTIMQEESDLKHEREENYINEANSNISAPDGDDSWCFVAKDIQGNKHVYNIDELCKEFVAYRDIIVSNLNNIKI